MVARAYRERLKGWGDTQGRGRICRKIVFFVKSLTKIPRGEGRGTVASPLCTPMSTQEQSDRFSTSNNISFQARKLGEKKTVEALAKQFQDQIERIITGTGSSQTLVESFLLCSISISSPFPCSLRSLTPLSYSDACILLSLLEAPVKYIIYVFALQKHFFASKNCVLVFL